MLLDDCQFTSASLPSRLHPLLPAGGGAAGPDRAGGARVPRAGGHAAPPAGRELRLALPGQVGGEAEVCGRTPARWLAESSAWKCLKNAVVHAACNAGTPPCPPHLSSLPRCPHPSLFGFNACNAGTQAHRSCLRSRRSCGRSWTGPRRSCGPSRRRRRGGQRSWRRCGEGRAGVLDVGWVCCRAANTPWMMCLPSLGLAHCLPWCSLLWERRPLLRSLHHPVSDLQQLQLTQPTAPPAGQGSAGQCGG